MTQHNAALVEETNAAIEQTEAQATHLDRIVDVFTLEEGVKNDDLKVVTPTRTATPRFRAQGNAALAADWEQF
jgi:methyl-accepting chemotaxis protein